MWRAAGLVGVGITLVAMPWSSVAGQSAPRREFTRQALLVAPFRFESGPSGTGASPRDSLTPRRNVRRSPNAVASTLARQFAEELHARLSRRLDGPELQVLGRYLLGNALAEADYPRDAVLGEVELRLVAGKVRADEVIFGRITRSGEEILVAPRLARLRNWTMQQPLPVVRALTVGQAAETVAAHVISARAQLAGLRRCENALQRSDRVTAVREAEAAIRAYPAAVIARDCLLAALTDERTGADSLLHVAEAALAVDSVNTFAAVARARALEALRRSRDAVMQWERIATAHADSLDLGRQTVEAFLRLQQPATAVRQADTLEARHGRDADLQRFRFRGYVGMARWSQAASLADTLDLEDAVFRADSNYASRHIEARRQLGDTVGALELAARAIRRFPQDGRLYLQYVQLVQAEQPAALPRGVLRFPEVPELHLLTAQTARRNGDRSTALRALRNAIQRDARRVTAYLQLADLYGELSMPDSALAILRRAPRDGEAGETVRAYVLARGLLAVRSVADSAPPAHGRGVALLQLADSMASREESRAMVTAALLQLARAHLVVAERSRGCPDVEAAGKALREAALLLERGTGPTAGELTAAYEAMRNAGQAAGRVLCGDSNSGDSNSGDSNSGDSNSGRANDGKSTNGRSNYGTRM